MCILLLDGSAEIVKGIAQYFADLWNVMDGLNYIIFFFVYTGIACAEEVTEDARVRIARIAMCNRMGYFDDWRAMEVRSLKPSSLYASAYSSEDCKVLLPAHPKTG